MIQTDVLIVGGGPAGAACAWRLKQHNLNCLILDTQHFPRPKPCAGWIPPEVAAGLELNLADYPHGLTHFDALYLSIWGIPLKLRTQQYAIRRIEFDSWLLNRSSVTVHKHAVKTIEKEGDRYVIDKEFSAAYLVGAGGTHCPVYRTFFKTVSPRAKGSLIVAQEEEFPYPVTDPHCQLWFLENHLPGYAWYVPKANGFVNAGIGGMAKGLQDAGDSLKTHWNNLVQKLDRLGLVRNHVYKPVAHSYYLRQNLPVITKDNAFITGDAIGLATLDMGEGIGPAIQSGLLAAEAIIHGSEYSMESLPKYSLFPRILLEFFRLPYRNKGAGPAIQRE
jgi:menaquinone-9 beta-reductase